MEKVSASITVPLRPTTVAKLRTQADSEGRTPAAMARYAIEQYLRSRQRPAGEEDVSTTPPADSPSDNGNAPTEAHNA